MDPSSHFSLAGPPPPLPTRLSCSHASNLALDLQDCAIQGLRPEMYYTRDRERRRAATPVPILLVFLRHATIPALNVIFLCLFRNYHWRSHELRPTYTPV